MPRVESTFIDKSTWERGPWDDEPDKILWEDEFSGLPCAVVRAVVPGSLCGYVAVQEGHPWFGEDHEVVERSPWAPRVPWGLTFADKRVPWIGVDNPRLWWFGFDCAHAGDKMPAMEARLRGLIPPRLDADLKRLGRGDVYRNVAYVTRKVTSLARACRLRTEP